MGTIDVSYSPEEIKEFATRDFVISAQCAVGTSIDNTLEDNKAVVFAATTATQCDFRSDMSNTLNRYRNDGNRKIGLIRGILDDGSFCLSILGDGVIQMGYRGAASSLWTICTYPLVSIGDNNYLVNTADNTFHWRQSETTVLRENRGSCCIQYSGGHLDSASAVNYAPQWQILANVSQAYRDNTESFLIRHGKLNNSNILHYNNTLQLTRSKDTTFKIGDLYRQYRFCDNKSQFCKNGYRNIGGAMYAISSDIATLFNAFNSSMIHVDPQAGYELYLSEIITGTYACHYIPFNLILTRNEDEAIRYLNTDILPSDAFIYPFDVDNIPTNTSGEDPDSGGGGSTPGSDVSPDEDGSSEDDTDPMPTDTPSYSPLRLTNNNLYWLSASDLRQFINWFWTDATDVASWSDLLDKIMGLYENLSQAIINIRYMPIMSQWLGTLGTDSKIIVGMLEKEHAVNIIPKSSTPIRDIGSYTIKPKFKDSFCNYSPYSSISIYLPFHGMVELDNDLIMGHKIYIRCAYDILSGTIQYFIHRDSNEGSLIYSTVAKMAVDIPITLQTKTDRDSAIFQNVGSVVGGLVGAGASLAGGSPIGLTMGLANMSGFQPSSAPLRVTGNVSESGAFYAPTKCAIYIKRPSYNRPELYKSRVGFPCNYEYKLSECGGFTTCYKPRINFSGVEYTENNTTVTIKPTHSEIEMIYDYLEKGVII